MVRSSSKLRKQTAAATRSPKRSQTESMRIFMICVLISMSGEHLDGNIVAVDAFLTHSSLPTHHHKQRKSWASISNRNGRVLRQTSVPSSSVSPVDDSLDSAMEITARIIDSAELLSDVVESSTSSSVPSDQTQQDGSDVAGWLAPTKETLAASEAAAMVFSLTTPEEVGLVESETSTHTETSSSIETSPSRNPVESEVLLINTKEEVAEDFVQVLDVPQPSLMSSNNEGSMPESTTTELTQTAGVDSTVPSYRKLAIFSATTILIWLSEPLLSLVDTTVVGLQPNSVLSLAAVGPATTLYDSSVYLCYFLAMATTNLLSAAHARGDTRALQKHTSHILGVSAVLGTAVSAFLVLAGPSMLGAPTSEWFPLAVRYVSIRGAVAGVGILGSVLQAFLLAMQNTTTPFLAVIAAAVFNTVGDLALAPKFGLAGVAAATAASTCVSAAILFRAVRKQMLAWRKQEQEESQNQLDLQAFDDDNGTNDLNKPLLSHKEKKHIPLLSLPDRNSLLQLVRIAGPMFFVYVAKVICYSSLTIRATGLGSVPLAAHSILMRVFFFFACFGDSLSQTAQSFLPATLIQRRHDGESKSMKHNNAEYKEVMKRMSIIALIFGALNGSAIVSIVKNCSRFITHDKAILRCMKNPVALACVGATTWMHPFYMMLEGTTVAKGQFKTITRSYFFTISLMVTLLTLFGDSFTSIWKIFAVFQTTRLSQLAFNHIVRPWLKQRKQNQELKAVPTPQHA